MLDSGLFTLTGVELPAGYSVRQAREDDHAAILAGIGDWWDGRGEHLQLLLPRLFLQHFSDSSWVVENEAGELGAFLVGFRSQTHPEVAYIHFIGVHPDLRRAHVAGQLYEQFFATMKERGCTEVRSITGPPNTRSQAFHASMGFAQHGPYSDYDGPGEHRVTFTRAL